MKTKGFTLIELLIVIAILGILVSLILPRFADVREDANTKVCVANMRGLVSAMSIYETRQNNDANWGTAPYTVANLVIWGYIAAEPRCPYENGKSSPKSYTLVPSGGGLPDRASCPNIGSYADHVWP
ncbi:MAG: prepilin-type N-terminal cleavage/methylation domain-containing protein [Candidatus Omnitrophota bacterium]